MKLADLHDTELCDWKTSQGYALELQHGLMGYFPLIDENKKIVVALDKEILKKIWESLTTHKVTLDQFSCMVNKETHTVIPISDYNKDVDSDDFVLIAEDDIETAKFRYASGLMSLVDESNATFPD